QVGNGGTEGAISGARISNGSLVFNRSDDIAVGGSILAAVQDPGDVAILVQAGTGKLTLTHGTLIRPDLIVIEDGTLQIHDTGDLPAGTENVYLGAPMDNNGALVFNSNLNVFWPGISGSGTVVQ